MQRWLRRLGLAAVAIVAIGLAALIYEDSKKSPMAANYTSNERLTTVKAGWPGTPIDASGRFVNDEFPYTSKLIDLLRWQLSGNPFKEAKLNDRELLAVSEPSEFLASRRDGILWLGHASFFIRLGGKSILIDPIFGKPPFIKTFVDVPSPLDKITSVDFILLSHDHRDHTDEESIRQITAKFPQATLLGGLGMDDILREWATPSNEIKTAGWFQQFDLGGDAPQITFVPVRHWSRRGLFDTNKRLWGGFVLQAPSGTIFFGGDSGYGRQYRQVGQLFPNIDVFLVGIGAFEPRWFMKPNHNSPDDALQAFIDTGARLMVPMHFGRFDLSDEPPGEPLRQLRRGAGELGLTDRVKVLNINESLDMPQ